MLVALPSLADPLVNVYVETANVCGLEAIPGGGTRISTTRGASELTAGPFFDVAGAPAVVAAALATGGTFFGAAFVSGYEPGSYSNSGPGYSPPTNGTITPGVTGTIWLEWSGLLSVNNIALRGASCVVQKNGAPFLTAQTIAVGGFIANDEPQYSIAGHATDACTPLDVYDVAIASVGPPGFQFASIHDARISAWRIG